MKARNRPVVFPQFFLATNVCERRGTDRLFFLGTEFVHGPWWKKNKKPVEHPQL